MIQETIFDRQQNYYYFLFLFQSVFLQLDDSWSSNRP